MAELILYKQDASQSGKALLKDDVFSSEIKQHLLHESIVNYLANQRRGTAKTKNRSEVSGGGIKPWKQKGTGRARQGSIRAPQWVGGGRVFGPTPRDYSYKLNTKIRHNALVSALSLKNQEKKLYILNDFKFEKIKTKQVVDFLKAFNAQDNKVLLVIDELTENIKASARNLENVYYTRPENLHPYYVLWAEKVFITKGATVKIEEALS
jgi:large subunit ribosomal protein L4